MKMTINYDVAIVGMQTAGLIAGALLSKRGLKVAIVDHGEIPPFYEQQGFLLPMSPQLIPAIQDTPYVQQIHDELKLTGAFITDESPVGFQAALAHIRLQIFYDRQKLFEELSYEFSDIRDSIKYFFDRLETLDSIISASMKDEAPILLPGFRKFWRNQALNQHFRHLRLPFEHHELLKGIPPDHVFRHILLGPLVFFNYLETSEPTTLQAARLIYRYFRGQLRLKSPCQSLAQLYADCAEGHGAALIADSVIKIDLQSKQNTLSLGHHNAIQANLILCNTFSDFTQLLPESRKRRTYAAQELAAHTQKSLFVSNFVVHKQVIPRGMHSALFLLNGRQSSREPDTADAPLFVQQFNTKSPDRVILSVSCPVNTHAMTHSPDQLSHLRHTLFKQLQRLIPFLEQHIELISLPMDTMHWDKDPDHPARQVDPWNYHPIFTPKKIPFLGVCNRSIATPFKQIIDCRRDVLPGLGLEGDYIVGHITAKQLTFST